MACHEANITVAIFDAHVKRDPRLQELYNEADQRGADAMADALVNIHNHRVHGQSDAKMAKVISDNIKWLLSKRKSKQYGERVTVDVNVSADAAIIKALTEGRQRALERREEHHAIIDAEVIEDDEDLSFLEAPAS